MSLLSKESLINALVSLGKLLQNPNKELEQAIQLAPHKNAWFTVDETKKALNSLTEMLNELDLEKWFEDIHVSTTPKKVGLILAGNIPLVGFHDVLCVLATGNVAQIKLSSSDDKLIPILLSALISFEPKLAQQVQYIERLKDFDAIIATGSNNTSRYFDFYFGKVPHIIRKNRNSVAVLNGDETVEQIAQLGNDIFDYFGLGCRNVSKVYLPKGYDIKKFFEPLEKFRPIINHFKYNNNYDYNKSIYLVNRAQHFDNGFLLLKEDENQSSPLAVLFFEYYENINDVAEKLKAKANEIQCVVTQTNIQIGKTLIELGGAQHPKLWDYADDVNTIKFLNNL